MFVAVLLFLSLPFPFHPSLLLLLDYLLQLRRRQQRQQQQNNQKTVNRSSCFASIEKFADSAGRGQRQRAATQQRRFLSFRYSCFTLLLLLLLFLSSVPVSVVVVAVIVYLHLDIRRLFVVAVVVAVVIALQLLTGLCETSCRGSDATLGLRRLRARRTPCRQAGREAGKRSKLSYSTKS